MLKKILAVLLIVPIVFFTLDLKPAIEVPVVQAATIQPSERDLRCLAENIYHEAKNQSEIGKIAVAFVTLNRSVNTRFPADICKVVYQKNTGICQFSWVCEVGKRVKDKDAFLEAKRIATIVLLRYNELIDPTNGALFFHAHYIKPDWSKRVVKTVRIDDHIFYKLKST